MPKRKPRDLGGRPEVEITVEQVRNAARCALNLRETAAVLGCSVRTLHRRMKRKEYAQAFEDGAELAKANVKRLLFKGAHQGSVKSQMFFANNLLGWSDKITSSVEQSVNFVVEIPAPISEDQWLQSYAGRPEAISVAAPNVPEPPKLINGAVTKR
jgi:hypothetical protein